MIIVLLTAKLCCYCVEVLCKPQDLAKIFQGLVYQHFQDSMITVPVLFDHWIKTKFSKGLFNTTSAIILNVD